MSRHIRWSAFVVLCAACTPGEASLPVPPSVPVPPTATLPRVEPHVRIGLLVDSAAAVISASAPYTLALAGGSELARARAYEVWTFRMSGTEITGSSDRGGRIDPVRGNIRINAANDTVQVSGRGYRGEVLLRAGADGVTAINVVALEAYLLGVVPREIGRRPANEIEAIKAQAVAARTYAIGNLNGRANKGFDFYATVMDQVYGGTADEDSIVSRAVRETAGQILTHNGTPILAYYSSTCGGSTADIEDSWPWRAPLAYLRGVSDRNPDTGGYYCDRSNRFRWETRWTGGELKSVLDRTIAAHTGNAIRSVDRISDFRITERNDSERVTVRFTADGRTYTLRADSVRWVLRTPDNRAILNSSMLLDMDTHIVNGQVTELHVQGGGWGHAIGMCQVGAMGRARAGQSYRQILQAYYTDTEIERLY